MSSGPRVGPVASAARRLRRRLQRARDRGKALQRTERYLRAAQLPRVQMALMLAIGGLFGFAASALLLRANLAAMALRYPLAVAAGYLVFLVLLRVWLAHQKARIAGREACVPDAPDLLDPDLLDLVPTPGLGQASGGGRFGGGGASGGFDGPAVGARGSGGTGGRASSWGVPDLDADVLGFLLLVGLALVSGLAAAGYLVYAAPALLAEVLTDGLLVALIYRRAVKIDETRWLAGAFRRTWLPALLVAGILAAVGFGLQELAPGARSLGQAWHAVRGR